MGPYSSVYSPLRFMALMREVAGCLGLAGPSSEAHDLLPAWPGPTQTRFGNGISYSTHDEWNSWNDCAAVDRFTNNCTDEVAPGCCLRPDRGPEHDATLFSRIIGACCAYPTTGRSVNYGHHNRRETRRARNSTILGAS